jgi:protein phosphatase
MVVDTLPKEVASKLSTTPNIRVEYMVDILREAMCESNRLVYQKGAETPQLKGMGAAVVACLIRDGVSAIAHMGDSRAYLMREAFFEQLTEDHTLAMMLLKIGQITEGEASKHPLRHALTRHVGMENNLGPHIEVLDLEPGDRLLLCSDGLTNEVSHPRIGEILWEEPDLSTACKKLVQAANEAGGGDNITVVIIQYEGSLNGNLRAKRVSVRQVIGGSLRRKEKQSKWL